MSGYTLPPLLSQDDTYWYLRHLYAKCEPPINSHFAGIVCNESGKGKSYTSIGITYPSYPDFDANESIAFTPERFNEIAAEKHPRHFPLILDDAGLSAFSGDALTLKVKRLSKLSQSIRHKHWQIIFNLPSFGLMAKSVKITNHYYIEPTWIDYDKQINHCKLQRLRIHPFTGKLKRMNMIRKYKKLNPVTGYMDIVREKVLDIAVPKAPDRIIRQYENLQSEFKQKFAEEAHKDGLKQKAKEEKPYVPSSVEITKMVQEEAHKFINNGKFSWEKIALEYKISDSGAINIARKLNTTLPNTWSKPKPKSFEERMQEINQ